jgi:hypothetical protein
MTKNIETSEKKRMHEKSREELKEKFRERLAKGEVMDFT